METETLSSYEQPQDKHVLDESMDVDLPRDDEESDSRESKENSEANSAIQHKEVINNATGLKEVNRCESSENKENENNDCDQSLSNSDNYNENEQIEGKELIESEETNENSSLNRERSKDNLKVVNHHKRNDVDRDSSDSDDKESLNNDNDEKLILSDEDKDLFSDDEILNDDEKDTSNEEESRVENDPLAEENPKSNGPVEAEKQKNDVLCRDDENVQRDKLQQDKKTNKDSPDDKEVENEGDKVENKKVSDDVANNETKMISDTDEKKEDHKDEESKDSVGKTDESKPEAVNDEACLEENTDNKDENSAKDCPLLKETLTKTGKNDDDEQQKDGDGENGLEEMDMDDDFDPSLLCPDIAMEVDEAPVITNSDNTSNDGNKSPLLYEPFFSTYVDEMTGAEVSFNLTPEEQQLRQQTFGEDNPVQYTKVHCTACNVHLGSALDGQSNRFVHPLLKVLICKDCYHFYTSGEFEKDEDGSELYCRWCGQGGQVMCCSGCEMVFCKKCVRINFGRKKLAEIRDSDDWFCFRCNPSQLISLRVHCAEFMEYVRREISRAATLENATSFMTTDFTQCCLSQKKKYSEPHQNEPKKKRRKTSIDPDYDPYREQDSPQPSTSGVKHQVVEATPPVPKPIIIAPKLIEPNRNAGVVTQVSSQATLFKVGNTTFRPRGTFSQPRPRVQPVNAGTTGTAVRPSGPGYIKIMPGGIRVTPTTSRTHTAQTFVSSSVRPQPSFQQRPPRPAVNPNTQMKHEWFEKTVRAAARVNSNLSYTLTQLNRAQSTATSVEALAVVHNKLQEILSTSINSLIQIRKNLRTEFIAGIKNIRFPSNKPPPPPPSTSTSAQDDDVIFVSPVPSPIPPPVAAVSAPVPPLTSIHLPPSVSFTKNPPPQSPSTSSDPTPSTSKLGTDKPMMFLRVKSLTALQNVPSECITIPDDPLPPPPPLTLIQQSPAPEVTVVDDQPEKDDMGIVIKDVTTLVETDPLQVNTDEKLPKDVEPKSPADKPASDVVAVVNGSKSDESPMEVNDNKSDESPVEVAEKTIEDKIDELKLSYNLNDQPSPEMKKMLSTKVYIKRSVELDELVKNTFGLLNGNASE